jgi:hypothetical protein
MTELPELPPNWYYEFETVRTEWTKMFRIVLKNGLTKEDSDNIQIHPEDSPEIIVQKFDESLAYLAKNAWASENPDKQWETINKYRWAIADAAKILVD